MDATPTGQNGCGHFVAAATGNGCGRDVAASLDDILPLDDASLGGVLDSSDSEADSQKKK